MQTINDLWFALCCFCMINDAIGYRWIQQP